MDRVTTLSPSVVCRVAFGCHDASTRMINGLPVLHVAVPVLAGAGDEPFFTAAAEPRWSEGCAIFRRDSRIGGFVVAAPDLSLEAGTVDVYRRLFAVTRGQHLYRIWNYVPHINAVEHGRENYQQFCRGRSLAFEEHFGPGFRRQLPAASAVGATAGPLALGFVAGETEPQHVENPVQVPAFEYPLPYGPRPPSFARATVVNDATGRQIFVSGTAAIRGHLTMAPGDLDGQFTCTLENLGLIAAAAGAGENSGVEGDWQRVFKIYLRHAADLPRVAARLDRELLRSGDTVQFLRADICRADLLVEIEATLTAPA